jgi:arylsulfatase
VTVPIPKTATDAHFRKLPPFIANEKNEGRRRWHWRFDTPERYQEYMKNYFRLASEVDATCGRVLALLKQQGALDNTLVIFTTDNGYFHAEHELADKWYPYEESIRVPLIVRDPRMADKKRGTTNDELTLNVDLAPTILAATGVVAPAGMQGHDIAPLYLAAEKPAWRTEFFYEHAIIHNKDFIPASQALVRKDWKYIFWPDFEHEQLFHLTDDPLEENDLASDSGSASKLEEMRRRMVELRTQAQ